MGKLNDRDKKLLVYALCVVAVICSFFFGFKKISAKNSELDTEIENNRARYNSLKEMVAKEGQYKEDTEYYNAEYNDILGRFDSGTSTEYLLLFVEQMEKETDMWASQTGFGETKLVYEFGKIGSSNPSTSGTSVYSSDYQGLQTTLTISYQCTYDDFKNLVDYINTYKFKNKIAAITCVYNTETGIVSGTMTLDTFAITGSDRVFIGAPINTLYPGTDNIFQSDSFKPGADAEDKNGNDILTDYDYSITLNSFKADADAIIVGPRGGTNTNSLHSNSKEREAVTITFDGSEEKGYTVSYRIGDQAYPAVNYDKGTSFNPGNKLSLLVVGATRDREGEDVNGADATIINNTDMTLYVKVVDDNENPRFKIKEKVGQVEVFE